MKYASDHLIVFFNSNNNIREDAIRKLAKAIAKHQQLIEIKVGRSNSENIHEYFN